LRLVASTAKTEKAKKNGLSSPFLIFTADVIIAKIRTNLKGVALSRQIARPAAQTGPIGAVEPVLRMTRFQAENVRVWGEE
jgi:hypothetical protein